MKHIKKGIIAFGLIGISLWYYTKPNNQIQNISVSEVYRKTVIQNSKIEEHSSLKSKKRKPAAISKNSNKNINKRRFIGEANNSELKIFINSYNKNWEKNYRKFFAQSLPSKKLPKDFKIKKLKPVVLTENGASQLMEHIIVSFKNGQGSPFSYEALVNSETGMLHKSWNQTHYERKKPVTLSATGQEYISQ